MRSETNQHENNSIARKLPYLVAGGTVGAALGLLFAPKPGSELRSEIKDAARNGIDTTIATARDLREKSYDMANAAREKIGELYGFADKEFKDGDMANDPAASLLDRVTDEPTTAKRDQKTAGHKGDSSFRRPSTIF